MSGGASQYNGDPSSVLWIEKHPDDTLWWACPDIWIGSPGGTEAHAGANTVSVRFQHDPNVAPEVFVATVQVFVYQPFVGAPPASFNPGGSSVYPLGAEFVDGPDFASTGQVAKLRLNVPPLATDAQDPSGIIAPNSHRCLIARVFPDAVQNPPSTFNLTDPHEAQRNIHIVGVTKDLGGPSEAGVGGDGVGTAGGKLLSPTDEKWWRFLVNAWATDGIERPEELVVRLRFDIEPRHFLEQLGEQLAALGIKRVETLKPNDARLVAVEGGPGEEPHELPLTVDPQSRQLVAIEAQLAGKRGGTAWAVHAEQSAPDPGTGERLVRGGTTILFHRADIRSR